MARRPWSPALACVVLALFARPGAAQDASRPPYRDPATPTPARVQDLLGRMTLTEKFWQLFMIPGDTSDPAHDWSAGVFGLQIPAGATARADAERINALQRRFVERTRLGIPIIPFDEAVHGLVRPGATVFPAAIALAATWNTALVAGRSRHRGRDAQPRRAAGALRSQHREDVRWGA
jgi:beta-glucosidase